MLDIAHPTTIIIPLTTNLINNAAPLRIRVKAQDKLKKDSDLLIDQVRAIDNKRLVQGPLTKLADDHIKEIGQALSNAIGVNSI